MRMTAGEQSSLSIVAIPNNRHTHILHIHTYINMSYSHHDAQVEAQLLLFMKKNKE